jgi:hypothetical protein
MTEADLGDGAKFMEEAEREEERERITEAVRRRDGKGGTGLREGVARIRDA